MNITVIESIELKNCCVCTQNSEIIYLNIFQNVINFQNNYISLAEILNELLDLKISQDSDLSFQEICSKCKTQIIDFYIFKKRNEDARKKLQNIQHDNKIEVEEHLDEISTYSDEQLTEILDETELVVTNNDQEIKKQSKIKRSKRTSNPDSWARNQRKYAKNSGQSYVASSGKFVEAKQMKPNCGEKCRMKCTSKISEDDRKRNFDKFYTLADIVKQRQFLFDRVRCYEPKKLKSNDTSQKTNRSIQRNYFLDIQKEDVIEGIQVCKHMFLNTFAISPQIIDTIYKKFKEDNEFNDIRGKFPRNKTFHKEDDE